MNEEVTYGPLIPIPVYRLTESNPDAILPPLPPPGWPLPQKGDKIYTLIQEEEFVHRVDGIQWEYGNPSRVVILVTQMWPR